MRAIAPAIRAWINHDAPSAAGIDTGNVTRPPSPVMKPLVKFFPVSHLINDSTRRSSFANPWSMRYSRARSSALDSGPAPASPASSRKATSLLADTSDRSGSFMLREDLERGAVTGRQRDWGLA